MTAVASAPAATETAPWTCPFCPLLCDDLSVASAATAPGSRPAGLALRGGTCAKAQQGLDEWSRCRTAATPVGPSVRGQPASLEAAVAEAARLLAASAQPLIGGLGTEVAGARALYRLACDIGAICDAGSGRQLMHTLRPLQDHGGFTTTLAEVRTRADLIVAVGGWPTRHAPRWLQRIGAEDRAPASHASAPARQWVLLGGTPDDVAAAQQAGHLHVEPIGTGLDLFTLVAQLGALVGGRAVRDLPPGLAELGPRLAAARYAVFIGATADLPAQGALIVEGLYRCVGQLNQRSRAAAMWLGGGEGASTVNQTFTWLSGLPLRSRYGPAGIEHDPQRFDAQRLMADGAVDALLWVSSLGTRAPEWPDALPAIVLGHPAMAEAIAQTSAPQGGDTVFIPVAVPGIGSAGHLFRTDGSVMLPLFAAEAPSLPGVAQVVEMLRAALPQAGRP
ncbi:formylmethanofuran dehydrogenase [Ideonella sp. DXS29W]|uniref:Formylmethanofuran dehydrogenase n=1 Tax=Ideonella lacteola TaxID=2984193 RepID=A0ABU9BME3_9BURK